MTVDSTERLEERIREIHAALIEEHGEPDPPRDMPPVEYVINTILSQNTADENRDAAFGTLKETYGDDYAAIERADHDELADTIRTAGLANQKATRIQDALKTIREYTGGEYSLDFIDGMETDEARTWLTSIRGIGPKTAALILLFRFDKPLFPVDTHCERVGKRFGLIPHEMSAEQAHDVFRKHVPDDIKYSFHILLITHGREYCSARNPSCESSAVCRRYCSYYEQVIDGDVPPEEYPRARS